MSSPIVATIIPSRKQTEVLVTDGPHEVLKARIPASVEPHPSALRTVLEGLSLWYQQPLRVVLSADGTSIWESLGLTDALGCGCMTLYYTVEVVPPRVQRKARRIQGLGSFRQARRVLRLAVAP